MTVSFVISGSDNADEPYVPPYPDGVDVVVTVDDVQHDQIAAVAQRLKAAGLTALQTLKSAGIITGNVDLRSLDGLKSVAGVKAVKSGPGCLNTERASISGTLRV
jgi:hypothetical protein